MGNFSLNHCMYCNAFPLWYHRVTAINVTELYVRYVTPLAVNFAQGGASNLSVVLTWTEDDFEMKSSVNFTQSWSAVVANKAQRNTKKTMLGAAGG